MSKVFGKENYDCMPERVRKTHLLTVNDKSLYSTLCNQAEMKRKKFDQDELNQSELADEVGCSERTIRRSLTKLAEYKLIEIIKNPGFPSEYKILNSDESLIPIEKSKRELRNEKIKAALSKFQNPVPKKEEKEILKLTPEQTDLKFFIESKIGEKVYNKQIIVLCNAAIENKNIDGNFEIIKSIIAEKCDYIRSKKNKIIKKMMGYIYVAIKKYSPSISENDKSEYHDEALSLSLKLKHLLNIVSCQDQLIYCILSQSINRWYIPILFGSFSIRSPVVYVGIYLSGEILRNISCANLSLTFIFHRFVLGDIYHATLASDVSTPNSAK